jgi:predicted DNA-binding transcriptional regulator AlpA
MDAKDKILIDIQELSRLTGISVGTLYHWSCATAAPDRRLPCVRIGKRCLRFRRDSILEWIEKLSD